MVQWREQSALCSSRCLLPVAEITLMHLLIRIPDTQGQAIPFSVNPQGRIRLLLQPWLLECFETNKSAHFFLRVIDIVLEETRTFPFFAGHYA